jgi:glucosamine 6-phosphate synthetase-like amidotransferase/phosphosugar isomerase protein
MCAVFGFVARRNRPVSLRALATIVLGNVNRGQHAFGFAWLDSRGRLRAYKQRGRLTDHLALLHFLRDARMLIGHLRWATHGSPDDNINNHPHPADGGWIVHNGMIHNYRQLVRANRLCPVSECDSEALGLLIERSSGDTLLRRCADTVESADGGLCMLGLWSRPATLVVARRGNPLSMSHTTEGVYLATLPAGLPGKVFNVADDSIRTLTQRSGSIRTRLIDLAPAEPIGGLYDAMGNYAGG